LCLQVFRENQCNKGNEEGEVCFSIHNDSLKKVSVFSDDVLNQNPVEIDIVLQDGNLIEVGSVFGGLQDDIDVQNPSVDGSCACQHFLDKQVAVVGVHQKILVLVHNVGNHFLLQQDGFLNDLVVVFGQQNGVFGILCAELHHFLRMGEDVAQIIIEIHELFPVFDGGIDVGKFVVDKLVYGDHLNHFFVRLLVEFSLLFIGIEIGLIARQTDTLIFGELR